ncbi:MAG: NTP transferase domain-containing protein [Candidatus Magasanikbacteria bacterium]|nr:NTP transferase domain-containing protein [Candidatus Magasanikbacteria bacterium]
MPNFAIVILAAGLGKRMGGGAPKVLKEIHGRPLVSYLVEAIQKSGVAERPVVVVSSDHTLVQEALGDSCDYVIQSKQLGTGHAAACARPFLEGRADKVMILYGDHPLIRPETIKNLQQKCVEEEAIISLFTTAVEDFEDWRRVFFNFGRIVRDQAEKIICIREKKDAAPEEVLIKEINPGLSCYDAPWLWENLGRLNDQNAQGEYYLTDLIKLAIAEGHKITSLKIDPRECLGVNTPEELEIAKTIMGQNFHL